MIERSSAVSKIVSAVVSASAEAIAAHLQRTLDDRKSTHAISLVAQALEYGYEEDLDVALSSEPAVGFDHFATSEIFQRHLKGADENPRSWGHIAAANEDLQLYSLRSDASPSGEILRGRSRASALVRMALRDCRAVKQKQKATRVADDSPTEVSIPSPLLVAHQLLSEPSSESSRVYASAALQQLLWERIAGFLGSDGPTSPKDISSQAISHALSVITNRWKTSKPIIADLAQNGPEIIYICNLLAMSGSMVLRVDLTGPTLQQLQDDPWPLMAGRPKGKAKKAVAAFWVHPQCSELPDVGTILNITHGLPLPIEGAGTVFCEGLRYASNGSVIAALTGQFGAGKTSVALSIAAALAPLGCRTLFLTCEELQQDIESRLEEAAPKSAAGAGVSLFRGVDAPGLFTNAGTETWFAARELSVAQRSSADPGLAARALEEIVSDTLGNAKMFEPIRNSDARSDAGLPDFAKPIIIIDGLHQLFSTSNEGHMRAALLALVQSLRHWDAVILFTFADDSDTLRHLDYHCDIVIELERVGFDRPDQRPERLFKLIKTRRQPSRPGAHIFHIHGPKGFRIKPMLAARTDRAKERAWFPYDRTQIAFLGADAPAGCEGGQGDMLTGTYSRGTEIYFGSHSLVIGKGSSGKAGFGLYTLHRRYYDAESLKIYADPELSKKQEAIRDSKLLVRLTNPFIESRVLVISFLYPHDYYLDLTNRLRPRSRQKRRGIPQTHYGAFEDRQPLEYLPVPNRLSTDTISLYPGHLSCENFLGKVESALNEADVSGRPYTGVLIDGLHNVFVQFPGLEHHSSMWPELFSLLRRRMLNVVTTYTKFDVTTTSEDGEAEEARYARRKGADWYVPTRDKSLSSILDLDYEQAQRKAAPLLSALVSAADYLFELSAIKRSGRPVYQLREHAALGREVARQTFFWDRHKLEIGLAPPDN